MSDVAMSPLAAQQLEQIISRLYSWGVQAYGGSEGAELYIGEVLDEFEAKLNILEQMPESFPLVSDENLAALGYRHLIVREQIVAVYRLDADVPKIFCVYDPHTEYRNALRLDLRKLSLA